MPAPSRFPLCPARRFPVAIAVLIAALLAGTGLTGCSEPTAPAGAPARPVASATAAAVAVATAAPALVQVNAGGQHTCGVAASGQAWCWGNNEDGQLGTGNTDSSLTPAPVAGGLAFRQISAGIGHTCAVTTGDRLYCWGEAHLVGVASPPAPVTAPLTVAPTLRFQAVSAGANHTCAITAGDRRAWCWGDNTDGGLGDGTTTFRSTPVPVAGGRAWRQVTAGNLFTCGITTTNVAFCWGADRGGTLGDGPTRQRRLKPVAVSGDLRFTQISSGETHTCAVATTGRAWCWGKNFAGMIGDGTTTDRYVPSVVTIRGRTFGRLTAGTSHTCGETTTNETYCWGSNLSGQLGNGNPFGGRALRPSLVVGGFAFAQVDADGDHACGRTPDNVVRCWGSNAAGQLGDGTTTNRPEPTPIVGS
jgi:alpha-tubulin suppressor-like RCC1 family protein